jgi:hypothetical protein
MIPVERAAEPQCDAEFQNVRSKFEEGNKPKHRGQK